MLEVAPSQRPPMDRFYAKDQCAFAACNSRRRMYWHYQRGGANRSRRFFNRKSPNVGVVTRRRVEGESAPRRSRLLREAKKRLRNGKRPRNR